ncbi:MAG: hypothetical protein B7X58_00735, partial [Marinobacter sp. 34-60-7]
MPKPWQRTSASWRKRCWPARRRPANEFPPLLHQPAHLRHRPVGADADRGRDQLLPAAAERIPAG